MAQCRAGQCHAQTTSILQESGTTAEITCCLGGALSTKQNCSKGPASKINACPQCSVTERWTAQLHASEEAKSCNRLLHGFTWHDRMPISVAGRQWLGLRLFSRPRAEIQSYLQVWAPCDFLIIIAQSLHSRSMRPFLDTQRADGTSMAYMRLKASIIALQTASHRRQLSPGAHQPMGVCCIIPNSFSIPACPSHAWT